MGGATATAAEGPGASPAPAAPELVNAGLDSAALDDTAELPSASVPPGAVAEGPQGNSSQWVGPLALAVAALGSWLLSVRQDEAEQNGARRVQALSAQQHERAGGDHAAAETVQVPFDVADLGHRVSVSACAAFKADGACQGPGDGAAASATPR